MTAIYIAEIGSAIETSNQANNSYFRGRNNHDKVKNQPPDLTAGEFNRSE